MVVIMLERLKELIFTLWKDKFFHESQLLELTKSLKEKVLMIITSNLEKLFTETKFNL